ncbi:MAG: hypothetical protein PUB86_00155 [Elusimicrobia bacterium]|nr:hypothetical protein [Elusimicrobiota bacterium]
MKKSIFTTEIIVVIMAVAVLAWLSARKINVIRAEAAAAASKESLIMLQDAVNVYRWDNENRCPQSLALLVPDYIEKIPFAYKTLSDYDSSVKYGSYGLFFDGGGGWIFDNNPRSEHYCEVFLNI